MAFRTDFGSSNPRFMTGQSKRAVPVFGVNRDVLGSSVRPKIHLSRCA